MPTNGELASPREEEPRNGNSGDTAHSGDALSNEEPGQKIEEVNAWLEEQKKQLEAALQVAEGNVKTSIQTQQQKAASLIKDMLENHDAMTAELGKPIPDIKAIKSSADKMRDWAVTGAETILLNAEEAQERQLANTRELLRSQSAAFAAKPGLKVSGLTSQVRNLKEEVSQTMQRSPKSRPASRGRGARLILSRAAFGSADAERPLMDTPGGLNEVDTRAWSEYISSVPGQGVQSPTDGQQSPPPETPVSSGNQAVIEAPLGRTSSDLVELEDVVFWGDRGKTDGATSDDTEAEAEGNDKVSGLDYESPTSRPMATPDVDLSEPNEKTSPLSDTLEHEDEVIDSLISPGKSGLPTTTAEMLSFQSWKIKDLKQAQSSLEETLHNLNTRLRETSMAVPDSAFLEQGILGRVGSWLRGAPRPEDAQPLQTSTTLGESSNTSQPLATELQQDFSVGISPPGTAPIDYGLLAPRSDPASTLDSGIFTASPDPVPMREQPRSPVNTPTALSQVREVPSSSQKPSDEATLITEPPLSSRPQVTEPPPPTTEPRPQHAVADHTGLLSEAGSLLPDIGDEYSDGFWQDLFRAVGALIFFVNALILEFAHAFSVGFYQVKNRLTGKGTQPRPLRMPRMGPTATHIYWKMAHVVLVCMLVNGIIANSRERDIWLGANGLTRKYMFSTYVEPPRWRGIPFVDGNLTLGFGGLWNWITMASGAALSQLRTTILVCSHVVVLFFDSAVEYVLKFWNHSVDAMNKLVVIFLQWRE